MNPVYETVMRSLECRQILNSIYLEVCHYCHSNFLRNELAYQSLERLCVIRWLISIRILPL